jgi:hypothetical protein
MLRRDGIELLVTLIGQTTSHAALLFSKEIIRGGNMIMLIHL